MACNCNKDGDVQYTITLNQQGPQGRQGNVGQNGFSPVVSVYSNTQANYQLKIITADGEVITPNLKGQDGTIPTSVATLTGTNTFTNTNFFANTVEFGSTVTIEGNVIIEGEATINDSKIITETEFDELADDVVDINSQLAGLSFKKYTEEEYASITNLDTNTLYMVTNPDSNTFKLYLGSIELEGGGGGTIVSGDNQFKTYLGNVTASVEAEPQI